MPNWPTASPRSPPARGACWTESLRPARPISVCAITGSADTLNPQGGGFPRFAFGGKDQAGRPKPAVQAVIDRWVQALECPAQPRQDEIADGVHTRVYGPGTDGAEVMVITIDGLGHHWAGGTSQAPDFLVGAPTDKLVATDVAWGFFTAHPAP